ncbi:MAG: 2-oxo acid dehydrogenase subunit E2 [Desulfarculaceae bacterium]|nr:2-oxo acid dehydrogenase subunit E2 [Desulfarculaceae bacterium]MCF8049527.1 2-oxo acid dehydrogenase subunit E2 [Desulfarculaceae bacterium]
MPKLGLTMTEGLLVQWQKREGDPVKTGDVLFVLETEKVTYEVEAPEDGVLGRILVPEGSNVPVGGLVAYLLRPGETLDDLPSASEPPPAQTADPSPKPAQESGVTASAAQGVSGKRVRATPLAKKLARKMGVDLGLVRGSGVSGRVVAEDIRAAAALAPGEAVLPTETEPRLVPLSGMRRAVANNMMHAKVKTAQTYMSLHADAGAVMAFRQSLLPVIEASHGVRLTITDLMMKVTGAAVATHPVINTRWTDEGILHLPEVHMGMAMALDDGLIVPVIRAINRKGLGQIAQERTELIARCRAKRFMPDDISGSTVTLSAMGMFGIESFTANLNRPESAILAVGAIIEKGMARKGELVVRPMVNLTLTYDHRIIDGAEAGKFMQTLKLLVEEPARLLV